jgi:hypothetical protein
MMVNFWTWFPVHLMTGIRSAYAYKEIVLGGDVPNDVALSLAAVLTANQDIH